MARTTRRQSESNIYHVMLRGINKQKIFYDEEDYKKFLYILSDCKKICQFELFAYCLMSNHIHLLIREGKEPLGLFFKRFGARFVYWYNSKYDRVGHLFQDRYKSEPVDTDEYFLTVLRYIHNNPVKAGITKDMFSYSFSSATAYTGASNSLVDIDSVYKICDRTTLIEFFTQSSDDKCMDVDDKKSNRINDALATSIAIDYFGVDNPEQIPTLPKKILLSSVSDLVKRGVSERQISAITKLSRYAIRKYY